MSDDTLVDCAILDQHKSKDTDLGVLMEAFDKAGVFYSVHYTENKKMSLYIQTNFGPHPADVCEMKFNIYGGLDRVEGMGV